MSSPRGIPFVVGRWVRGERFYGRGHLISEILDGHRNQVTRESNALERVRQEIFLPRDLAHPNVLRVYDLGNELDAISTAAGYISWASQKL
jgi:hypothetical protein